MNEIESAFGQVCKVLLSEKLDGSIDEYSSWLGKRVPLPFLTKSALSGKEVWAHPGQNYLNRPLDASKTVSMDEMDKVNTTKAKFEDIQFLTVAELIKKAVKPIVYYCGDFRYGEFYNIEKCSGAGGGANLYYCEDVYFGAKNCAFCNFTSYSENMFGCNVAPYSSFCIHAYNSSNITRCFEVDNCINSRDLFFCHNCEGMNDGIFCFNAKNLRYAVGNVVVGREKFMNIKKILLNYIVSELKSRKDMGMDIYEVAIGRL